MSSDSNKKKPTATPAELTEFAEGVVEFLKDGSSKRQMQEFLVDAFRAFEKKRVDQFQARVQNEAEVNARGASEFHDPGNIAPIMASELNMFETERAFARSLRQTKNTLTRAVEDRVEEINSLLAGLGGYSSQLKSCFARSTVVFLEEEDPKFAFRERLIFSINLPNYELKRSWNDGVPSPRIPDAKGKRRGPDTVSADDLRTPLQATWDDAVNSLAQIIATTGLKPKYVKNDRHYGRFVMKQDLRATINLPDEYFSFTLDYNTAERIQEMIGPYNKVVGEYDKKIEKLAKKMESWPANSHAPRFLVLQKKHLNLVQEREFFVGTTPDPNQLDEGLLFLIEVSTLKDYHIVKDRMQAIMTKYILHLSKLAEKEASIDPDLEYEIWKNQQKTEAAAPPKKEGLSADEIEQLPEYVLADGKLKPVKKAA